MQSPDNSRSCVKSAGTNVGNDRFFDTGNFDGLSRWRRWSKNEFSRSLSPEPTAVPSGRSIGAEADGAGRAATRGQVGLAGAWLSKFAALTNMKHVITFYVLFVAGICSCAAGEVKLFVEYFQGTNATCCITNSTENEVYISTCYSAEDYYWPTNCPDCKTNWYGRGLYPILQTFDGQYYRGIPVPSSGSTKLNIFVPNPYLWRVTFFGYTNNSRAINLWLRSDGIQAKNRPAVLTGRADVPFPGPGGWERGL
jgi:hypothetical protein